ncbi:glycosyltransferase [Pseudomonas sp. COR58]|uniref:Glycosyltransferase n=1 Tax=Pseudomonas ekonensis TaxID=2842353 RepID=A0ABS6PDT0_9PSED|nr:glycosyltransferase [Pseudomonas ekonensis]
MIGVVVPAHNEQALLADCLSALCLAACHPGLAGETVRVLLVLDDCVDGSGAVAADAGIECLSVSARNVGYARGIGVSHLIALGARWIACTDADSEVAPDWLVAQLSLDADMVCGTVHVRDWGGIGMAIRQRYADAYTHAENHRHIHGANLGFCAVAYLRAGGFKHLPVDEDVCLVKDFERSGASISWSQRPRVVTSARLEGRARDGFAGYLRSLVRGEEAGSG